MPKAKKRRITEEVKVAPSDNESLAEITHHGQPLKAREADAVEEAGVTWA
jgi:hypothetical protein